MYIIFNCGLDSTVSAWLLCRYTDSQNLFDRRHDFDNMPNLGSKQVFASEYAVVNDPAGRTIPFPGNARVS